LGRRTLSRAWLAVLGHRVRVSPWPLFVARQLAVDGLFTIDELGLPLVIFIKSFGIGQVDIANVSLMIQQATKAAFVY
jgi:hypothetical protein